MILSLIHNVVVLNSWFLMPSVLEFHTSIVKRIFKLKSQAKFNAKAEKVTTLCLRSNLSSKINIF